MGRGLNRTLFLIGKKKPICQIEESLLSGKREGGKIALTSVGDRKKAELRVGFENPRRSPGWRD